MSTTTIPKNIDDRSPLSGTAAGSENAKPGGTGQENAKPGGTGPETTGPGRAGQERAKSGSTERGNDKPDSTGPETSPVKTTGAGGRREFDLIITVVNRGFSDQAIEAAKDAGATGATVLYARGTGVHEVEKFFAISIQPEKEIILTLVRRRTTKDVMHAIIESAGLQTEGRGLCFSLPVDEVTGIVRWMKGDGTEAQPPADAEDAASASRKKKKEKG